MIFEISIIVLALVFSLILFKSDKNIFKKFGLAFIAVLLFEYFTQALWLNKGLAPLAYLYLDVSWIIGLGWATIIIVMRSIADMYFHSFTDRLKFFINLIMIGIVGFFAEWVVLGLDIREYSEAVKNTLSGITIGPVPIEAIYYIHVFMALVLSFNLYWESLLNINESKLKRKSSK